MAFISAILFLVSILFATPGPLQAQSDRVDSLHAQASSAEASGDLATAIERYREILKIDPRLAPAYNNLGALYFKKGEFQNAAEVLERGLKIDPGMSSAAALVGLSLSQMGEYRKARPYLETALKANPSDDNAELRLVNDLTKLGEFETAAVHLRQLAKRQPGNQRIWYLLGRVYMQLSEQALGKVNEIDPDSVWAHEISAELMESMKNYDGAIVEYKKAVEVAPKQPGVHFKLGDLYWSLSQWDNASAQFEQERLIDPKNCMVEWKLGDILLQKSVEFEQALSHVDKALAACPNLTEARADRGKLLVRMHRDGEAISELLAAEKSNPAEPSTHFVLAQAYRATGRAEEAKTEMKSFAELEGKTRNAAAERASEVIKNSENAR
ncbi:MAG: tetratricopeptide repeat protein [Acidobacteriota bacterium]|nr:tetratricopeptide repeat protein [Acidobacteriota bacterium]